jgi:uncharacterized phiE125 gp8 family phage protein
MPSILLVPPVTEPVSLAQAKAFLRVEHGDDDDLITSLIAAARARVEALTRRALIVQTWRLVRDAWPGDGRLPVLPAPLRALIAARVHEAGGNTLTLDLQAFTLDTAAATGVIAFAPWSLPVPGRAVAGIELDIEVGYGAAADVPAPLAQAIQLLVAHAYENRAAAGDATTPDHVAALVAPYRVLAL